jgi:hypothetical protein
MQMRHQPPPLGTLPVQRLQLPEGPRKSTLVRPGRHGRRRGSTRRPLPLLPPELRPRWSKLQGSHRRQGMLPASSSSPQQTPRTPIVCG